jgi:phospholipid/cholesterol/gamma-HCH transport system substrate-binding protein
MDKRIANNLIVGVMVIVGFAALIFILFNIGGGMLNSRMTVYGKFKQVKGLFMGSEVSLSGLRIGAVRSIRIQNAVTKELIVEMSISAEQRRHIRQDSIATVKTQGILGDKYIEISIGDETLPEIKDGDMIPTSEPEDLFTKGGNVVSGISKQFEKEGDLANLIKNLNVTAINLAQMTTQIKKEKSILHELFYGQSGEKVRLATEHLESILRKINGGEGTVGAIINDPTVYEDIKSITGGAKRSAVLQYFVRQFMQNSEKDKKPAVDK